MRRTVALVAATVLVASCGGQGDPSAQSTTSTSSTTSTTIAVTSTMEAPTTTTTPASTTSSRPSTTLDPGLVDLPGLARYLGAVDLGLRGTAYEGEVFLDPETFVTTGVLFCDMLDYGFNAETVISVYAATVSAGGELLPDDLTLGGVVLGAAVQVICPEHQDVLDEP